MSSLCSAVLVCHLQLFESKSFVICLVVSRGTEVNKETTSKNIMISSALSLRFL